MYSLLTKAIKNNSYFKCSYASWYIFKYFVHWFEEMQCGYFKHLGRYRYYYYFVYNAFFLPISQDFSSYSFRTHWTFEQRYEYPTPTPILIVVLAVEVFFFSTSAMILNVNLTTSLKLPRALDSIQIFRILTQQLILQFLYCFRLTTRLEFLKNAKLHISEANA